MRFADDLIIYASSFAELVDMLDILVEELRAVGLELNAKKSKIFTTDRATVESAHPILVDCADAFIEVMRAMDTHKYLGCCYPGDLLKRGPTILEARLRCAWSKFSLFRHSLVNRHVDIKLRLRLFESVVTPAALYALTTAPLSAKSLERLAVTQRKMLRSIVGWVPLRNEDWADMYRRQRLKLEAALQRHPVRNWVEELISRKEKLRTEIVHCIKNPLTLRVAAWDPQSTFDDKLPIHPRRRRGRPRTVR